MSNSVTSRRTIATESLGELADIYCCHIHLPDAEIKNVFCLVDELVYLE